MSKYANGSGAAEPRGTGADDLTAQARTVAPANRPERLQESTRLGTLLEQARNVGKMIEERKSPTQSMPSGLAQPAILLEPQPQPQQFAKTKAVAQDMRTNMGWSPTRTPDRQQQIQQDLKAAATATSPVDYVPQPGSDARPRTTSYGLETTTVVTTEQILKRLERTEVSVQYLIQCIEQIQQDLNRAFSGKYPFGSDDPGQHHNIGTPNTRQEQQTPDVWDQWQGAGGAMTAPPGIPGTRLPRAKQATDGRPTKIAVTKVAEFFLL